VPLHVAEAVAMRATLSGTGAQALIVNQVFYLFIIIIIIISMRSCDRSLPSVTNTVSANPLFPVPTFSGHLN
jgi:hypothetical protein